MLPSKSERAQLILSKVRELDLTIGTTVPARLSTATQTAREIQISPKYRARFTPNHRITIGRLTERDVGARYLRDPNWTLFELEVFGKARLVINLRGSEIDLFRYIPGAWEIDFDVDPRDTDPYDRVHNIDPGSAEWQALEQTPDFQLPPLREGAGLEPPPRRPWQYKQRKRLG